MDFGTINYFAVLAAAVSTFLIGAVWYSPMMFYNAWLKANNFNDEEVRKASKARMFGWSFVFSFIIALNLALFLNAPETDFTWGATAGFLTGFGWVALSIGVVALFEGRSWTYILINGGYNVMAFTIMGAILGFWR
jgi:hypothetical protein